MKRPAWLLLLLSAAAIACDGTTVPARYVPPEDDSLQVWFRYSAQEAVTRFGRYRVDVYEPPTYPRAAPDGEFVVIATSDGGHRVGKVAGRFAIWPAGTATPSYLFPADTNVAALTAVAINDRQEVLFQSAPRADTRVFHVWKSGQMQQAYSQERSAPKLVRFTNSGWFGGTEQFQLHLGVVIFPSPFAPDLSGSGHFPGEKCSAGITNTLEWLADDRDALIRHNGSSFIPGSTVIQASGGCADIGQKFKGVSVGWTTVEAGLAGGLLFNGSGFGLAVITDGSNLGALNDLLDDASRAAWRITSITRIFSDRTMLATAVALSDSRVATVRLKPAG